MSRNHALISFRPFAKMLMVNTADVRTADRRGLHLEQHFSVSRLRNRHVAQFHSAVAWQKRTLHHDRITPSRSHRSSQLWFGFHKKTCPLMSLQLRSIDAIACMSCAVRGGVVTLLRLAIDRKSVV